MCALVLGLTSIPDASADESVQATDLSASEQKQHAMQFGEVVYSLYVDDALTTLSKMALAKQQIGQSNTGKSYNEALRLLEGGVGLGYGMPRMAQQNLSSHSQSLSNEQRPVAWYWLARLHFSQSLSQSLDENSAVRGLQRGLEAYNTFVTSLDSSERDLDEILTPAQWYELNYQAAQASMALKASTSSQSQSEAKTQTFGIERFLAVLPQHHISRQYLGYNQAVNAFARGDYDDANQHFLALQNALMQKLENKPNDSGWFSWFNWWQDDIDESETQRETKALLNEVLLSRGQTLLMLARQDEALTVFDSIDTDAYAIDTTLENGNNQVPSRDNRSQSLIRDEALLHYGWGLAQSGDWPLAMGVWTFLSEQDNNLYTLQATHALAYGYAELGGEVQAYDTLQRLIDKLSVVIAELDVLSQQVEQERYWQSVALGSGYLRVEQQESESREAINGDAADDKTPWQSLWPASQKDLLFDLITSQDTGNAQQHKLENLSSLYQIQGQLSEQRALIDTYNVLLDEREQAHQSRVANYQSTQSEDLLRRLSAQFDTLQQRVSNAERLVDIPVGEGTNESWVAGLATFASEEQLAWLARVTNAEQRLQLLSQQRTMRPSYSERLARVKGVLAWQLSQQYLSEKWKSKQALIETEKLFASAQSAQNGFNTLLNTPKLTGEQRDSVSKLQARIDMHLENTSQLIVQLEVTLTDKALALIQARKTYLAEQYALSQLAMLQLRDGNMHAPVARDSEESQSE